MLQAVKYVAVARVNVSTKTIARVDLKRGLETVPDNYRCTWRLFGGQLQGSRLYN